MFKTYEKFFSASWGNVAELSRKHFMKASCVSNSSFYLSSPNSTMVHAVAVTE